MKTMGMHRIFNHQIFHTTALKSALACWISSLITSLLCLLLLTGCASPTGSGAGGFRIKEGPRSGPAEHTFYTRVVTYKGSGPKMDFSKGMVLDAKNAFKLGIEIYSDSPPIGVGLGHIENATIAFVPVGSQVGVILTGGKSTDRVFSARPVTEEQLKSEIEMRSSAPKAAPTRSPDSK
jgi:hypothetical protein